MSIAPTHMTPLHPQHLIPSVGNDGGLDLSKADLDESNVTLILERALKEQDLTLIKSCCSFIHEQSTIRISPLNKPPSIYLKILISRQHEFVFSEKSLKYLDQLTSLLSEESLEIEFDKITDFNEEVITLIRNYGKFIKQLDINSEQIHTQGEISTALEFCPNLNKLWISNPGLTDWDLRHLDRLEKLNQLELNSCTRLTKLPNLSVCISLFRISINKCSISEFPSIAGHPALREIQITDCHELENYPDFTGCTQLLYVTLKNCSKLKGRPLFYGCEMLESINIDGCPLNEQVDLNDCARLRNFLFGQGVEAAPLFSSCANLEGVNIGGSHIKAPLFFGRHPRLTGIGFKECCEFDQAARITSFQNFIRCNQETGYKLLNQFEIYNPTSLATLIIESTVPPYYDFEFIDEELASNSKLATQQFRMDFLEHLVRTYPKTALKYHLFFEIEDQNYIIDLFKNTDVIKEFTSDPSFRIHDPKNLVLYCSYLQMVRDNDFPKRIPYAGAYYPLYDKIELNTENFRQLNQFFYRYSDPILHWKGLINYIDDKMIISFSIEDRYSMMEADVTSLFAVLEVAVEIRDIALVKKILNSAAYLNPENSLKARTAKNKALLKACKNRDPEMTLFLIEQGADAKFVGGTHDHQTPLSEARIYAETMAECLPSLERADNGFTDEVMDALILAHKYGIAGTRKMRIEESEAQTNAAEMHILRTGFRPRHIVHDYIWRSRPFYDRLKIEMTEMQGELFSRFSPEVQHLIQGLEDSVRRRLVDCLDIAYDGVRECLDYEGVDIDANDCYLKNRMLSRLDEGKPLSLFGVTRTNQSQKRKEGPSLHAWGFVIFKSPDFERYTVYYCNRGYGIGYFSGSVAITVDEMEMLKLVHDYQSFTRWKTASDSRSDMFLHRVKNRFWNQEGHIFLLSGLQRCGNCCYTSLQAIELSLLHGLFSPIIGHEPAVLLAKGVKSLRSTEGRIATLRDYLQRHSSHIRPTYSPDIELINKIMERIQPKDEPKYIPMIEMITKFNTAV